MDSSLFIESNKSEKRIILTKFLKYNYKNKYLDINYIQNIFNIYNLNKKIKNINLLEQIFVHTSYCYNNELIEIENDTLDLNKIESDLKSKKLVELKLPNQSNEKLDWLGDSLIGYLISIYLINRFTDSNEGFLSKLRTSLIKSKTLAKIVRKLELDKYLIISNHMESLSNRNNDNILQIIFKSLISYIDIEYDIYDRNIFLFCILESLINFSELIITDINFKDILIRYYHYNKLDNPKFEIAQIDGLSNNRIFTTNIYNSENNIIGEGTGKSKKESEQNAAKDCLEKIQILDNNILCWCPIIHKISSNKTIKNINIYYYKYNYNNKYIYLNNINNILKKYCSKTTNNIHYYQKALIHKSYIKENISKNEYQFAEKIKINKKKIEQDLTNNKLVELKTKSYERLEWFGDSVLKYFITKYLLKRFSDKEFEFLTEIRSKLTNSYTLSNLGKHLNLHHYMIISLYEENINSRNNPTYIEDIMEAFIGAITLDLGEECAYEFVINLYESHINFSEKIHSEKNYKHILQKLYQTKKWNYPIYHEISIENVEVNDTYSYNLYTIGVYDINKKTIGIGKGKSKKIAEQNASKDALTYLQN